MFKGIFKRHVKLLPVQPAEKQIIVIADSMCRSLYNRWY